MFDESTKNSKLNLLLLNIEKLSQKNLPFESYRSLIEGNFYM